MDPVQIVIGFAEALAEALPKLVAIFTASGSKDAFLKALDASLAVARAQDDRDLAAKHAHDAAPGNTGTPMPEPSGSTR